jgi:hypothetical protein
MIGHNERHANAGPARGQVIVPALEGVAPVIEKAFLILAEAIVMFVVG